VGPQTLTLTGLDLLIRKPKKRAKVVPSDPNERFISMEVIKEVKAKVAREQAKKGINFEEIATFDHLASVEALSSTVQQIRSNAGNLGHCAACSFSADAILEVTRKSHISCHVTMQVRLGVR
jgi:hypothetical protein